MWQRHGDPLIVFIRVPVNEGLCKIDGCANPRSARGWCTMHYTRYRTHGDAEYVKKRTPPVPKREYNYVVNRRASFFMPRNCTNVRGLHIFGY